MAGARAARAPRPVLRAVLDAVDPAAVGSGRADQGGRAHRTRATEDQDALGRAAAAPGRRDRHRRAAGAALSRRADRGLRSRGAARVPRSRAPADRPPRHHGPAHHARSRRGREARRPDPDPQRRPDRRERLGGRTQPADRRRSGSPLEHRRAALRALDDRSDEVRVRAFQAARRGRGGSRGPPGFAGGHLHDARTSRRNRRRVRRSGGSGCAMTLSGAKSAAARTGLRRGLTEFRQQWTNREDLVGQIIWILLLLGTVFFMRNVHLPGTSVSLGAATVPSMLGAGMVFGALNGAAGYLAIDREDGTLLRAKATPNGMLGYLIGKILSVSLGQVLGTLALLI